MPDRIPQMQAEIAALKKKISRIEIYTILGIAIGLLRLVWPMSPGGAVPIPAAQTQSVKIGEHAPINTPSDHADYLTVAQVAKDLGLSERTVLTAIAEDRIFPEPTKPGGRAWAIDRNYRYLPPSTADSR